MRQVSLFFHKNGPTLARMKLNRGVNRRLRTVVAAVFAVQLLVSSFCFAIPASAGQAVATGHCHEKMLTMHSGMPMEQPTHHDSGKGCAHCDAPQNLNTVSVATDLAPAAVLIAIVEPLAEVGMPVSADVFSAEKAQAPPDSSDLLLTTTQRIRI